MVNSLCNVIVKNKFEKKLKLTIKQLFDEYYMLGYNYILCKNDQWSKIAKLQKKNKIKFNKIKLSNFKYIYISDYCELLSNGDIIENTEKLNLFKINKSKVINKGYSILIENNFYIQVDNFYVRFDEIKRAE